MLYASYLGRTIELTSERKKHILIFHPDLKPYVKLIKEVLLEPDELRVSKSDPKSLLFYKHFATILQGKYIAVVVKFNERNFILSSYLTNHIKSGEKYEQE